MFAGELTAAEVVDGNGACGCTVGVLVDQDDGQAAGAQTLDFSAIPTGVDRRDEDSGDSLFVEETKVALLSLGRPVGVAQHHRVPAPFERCLGASCDVGEERVAGVEDDESDDLAVGGSET